MKIPSKFDGKVFNEKTGLTSEQWYIEADGTLRCPIAISEELLHLCVYDDIAVRVRKFEIAIEESYQRIASQLDYKSPERMVSYIGCPKPQWDADGRAMQEHMTNTAILAYQIMERVQLGQIPEPTVSEFMAMLPRFVRPNLGG